MWGEVPVPRSLSRAAAKVGSEPVGVTVPSHVFLEAGPTNKARKVGVAGRGRVGRASQAFVWEQGSRPGLLLCEGDLRVSCVQWE